MLRVRGMEGEGWSSDQRPLHGREGYAVAVVFSLWRDENFVVITAEGKGIPILV